MIELVCPIFGNTRATVSLVAVAGTVQEERTVFVPVEFIRYELSSRLLEELKPFFNIYTVPLAGLVHRTYLFEAFLKQAPELTRGYYSRTLMLDKRGQRPV
jgi:hypothetical protein